MNPPRISLFSTPLVATWVLDDTHRILFDAGDGVSAALDGRIHRCRLVALTHTHRDHCAGLMQLLNLRGGAGDFQAVYPAGSGSARALAQFLSTFDSRTTGKVTWKPLRVGDALPIEPPRHFLRAFETEHYPRHGSRPKSLGYQIVRHVDKLKAEFRELPQADLDAVRRNLGREGITETVEDILFTITGDTVPLDPSTFVGSRVLMHECTFLRIDESMEESDREHPHSCLDDVIRTALEARVGRLGLYHVSRRYDDATVIGHVREACARFALPCPVSVALAGREYDDLFSQAVWQGADGWGSNP